MNIYDIAKLSGVSIATVSRVLNNKQGVSDAAKARVLRTVEEHNFIPNQLAKSLANKKSYVIGIVMPGINHYFSNRIDAIHKLCKEQGYSLMITANYKDSNIIDEDIKNFNLLIEKRVDGIIYFPTHVSVEHNELLKRIQHSIPMVITDRIIEGVDVPYVIQDAIEPTKKMTQYLLESGHQVIGYINGLSFDQVNNERFETFRSYMMNSGIGFNENLVEVGDFSLESGYRAMKSLLWKRADNMKRPMTAVFASNDTMAMGAIKAIHDSGLKVPEDISVVGFDGLDYGQYYSPSLTTVKVNQYALGEWAADAVLAIINGNEVPMKNRVMDYELIIGQSSKGLFD